MIFSLNAPWYLEKRGVYEHRIKDASGAWVATTGGGDDHAKVIAASPELLAALDRAHSRLLTFDTMAKSGKHDNIPAQDDLLGPIGELLRKLR